MFCISFVFQHVKARVGRALHSQKTPSVNVTYQKIYKASRSGPYWKRGTAFHEQFDVRTTEDDAM